jgi:hypothetical protein
MTVMADDLDRERAAEAETLYEDFDFGSGGVAANGWERATGDDEWTRVVFVEPSEGGGDSVKATFHVAFRAGSAEPADVYANVDGSIVHRKAAGGPGPG